MGASNGQGQCAIHRADPGAPRPRLRSRQWHDARHQQQHHVLGRLRRALGLFMGALQAVA